MNKKPWNVKMSIDDIDNDKVVLFSTWYNNITNNGKRITKMKAKQLPCPQECIDYIESLYNDGYGLKVLAKEFNLSYTKMRSIFDIFNINIRKGLNVVTPKLRDFRSDRVKGFKNPWSNEDCRKNIHSNGIQGYYTNKQGNKFWLRSCWEYIYAKWLDENDIFYSYELKQYILSDGTSYRPDFFILDDKGNIKEIVEIKGYIKDKSYKVNLLEKEYNINIKIIENINNYCKNYEKELKKWKTLQEK
jgi:AraC-like DNA-binding protein